MDLKAALNEAYHSWAQTGVSSVPQFDAVSHNMSEMNEKLADLKGASDRCVICKVQAAWLQRVVDNARQATRPSADNVALPHLAADGTSP